MNIETALKLKVGDRVVCPPDRGDKGYVGTITFIGQTKATAFGTSQEYIRINVKGPHHDTVWPSNRLRQA